MPKLTPNSRGKFATLFHTVRVALDRVEDLLDVAITNNNATDIVNLARARKSLKAELFRLRELEMDYQASARGVTEAENELAKGAADARGHVKSMASVAKALNAVAKLSSTITQLLAFFP